MSKLIFICVLAFSLAWLLCYGAMRTAERIAKRQQAQIESVERW